MLWDLRKRRRASLFRDSSKGRVVGIGGAEEPLV